MKFSAPFEWMTTTALLVAFSAFPIFADETKKPDPNPFLTLESADKPPTESKPADASAPKPETSPAPQNQTKSGVIPPAPRPETRSRRPEPPDPERMLDHFLGMDDNNDGVIERSEFKGPHPEIFDEADTNHDGKLTLDELKALAQKMTERMKGEMRENMRNTRGELGPRDGGEGFMLRHMDQNHDGKIQREEAKGPIERNFDEIDTNHDGVLDKEELQAWGDKMRQFADHQDESKRLAQRNPKGNPPSTEGKPAPEPPRKDKPSPATPNTEGRHADPAQIIQRWDKNGDGAVERDEFPKDAIELFDVLDRNGDGKLTPEELSEREERGMFGAFRERRKNREGRSFGHPFSRRPPPENSQPSPPPNGEPKGPVI